MDNGQWASPENSNGEVLLHFAYILVYAIKDLKDNAPLQVSPHLKHHNSRTSSSCYHSTPRSSDSLVLLNWLLRDKWPWIWSETFIWSIYYIPPDAILSSKTIKTADAHLDYSGEWERPSKAAVLNKACLERRAETTSKGTESVVTYRYCYDNLLRCELRWRHHQLVCSWGTFRGLLDVCGLVIPSKMNARLHASFFILWLYICLCANHVN